MKSELLKLRKKKKFFLEMIKINKEIVNYVFKFIFKYFFLVCFITGSVLACQWPLPSSTSTPVS